MVVNTGIACMIGTSQAPQGTQWKAKFSTNMPAFKCSKVVGTCCERPELDYTVLFMGFQV